jgi:acyl-CoA synthetase (NDP forming)
LTLTEDQLRYEPALKNLLRERGFFVPRGIVVSDVSLLESQAADLTAPLVLKVFGPGITHKTELGAVKLGLTHGDLTSAADVMLRSVRGGGGTPEGFLVEEQQRGGLELLVGFVLRAGVPVLSCGLGGQLAEVIDDLAVRLLPIDDADADDLLSEFRGATVWRQSRHGRGYDRAAMRAFLIQFVGRNGFAEELIAAGVGEFECNPVIVQDDGYCIVDARTAPNENALEADERSSAPDLNPLFYPKTIAIAGVSKSGNGMGNAAVDAYKQLGWSDRLYVLHPSAEAVAGLTAHRSLADVPGGRVDYLKVMVPASQVLGVLESEASRARSIQIVSSGFAESGDNGAMLEETILRMARAAGVPLVGPNCMGAYCPTGQQTYQLNLPRNPGSISIVVQSGGVGTDVIEAAAELGSAFSKVLSIGNAVDVSAGDVVEYFVDDDETEVIGVYFEDLGNPVGVVRALRRASGRKPVVVLPAGFTKAGGVAAASHTGALTTDQRLIEAMVASTGAVRVATVDGFVTTLVSFARSNARVPQVARSSVLVAGLGGGSSVLAGDAFGRAGVLTPMFSDETASRLRQLPPSLVKSYVNPLELSINPGSAVESTREVIDLILARDVYSDVLLHTSVRTFYQRTEAAGSSLGEVDLLIRRLEDFATPLLRDARVHLVLRGIERAPDEDRRLLVQSAARAGIPVLQT